MKTKQKSIKFLAWDMGEFLKYFIISITLFALCGSYLIILIKGMENFIEATNYLVFILTIVASVLSVVSLILSYENSKQAFEMQQEITEKLIEIRERVSASDMFNKKQEDWKS